MKLLISAAAALALAGAAQAIFGSAKGLVATTWKSGARSPQRAARC